MQPFVMIQDSFLYADLEVEFHVEGATAAEIADQVSLRISEFFEGSYPLNLKVRTTVRPLITTDSGKVTTWTATVWCRAT